MIPRRTKIAKGRRNTPKARQRHLRVSLPWPTARLRRNAWVAFRASSWLTQSALGVAAFLALALAINWTYQVVRKPTELFFPVSDTLAKTPLQTWQAYGPIFRANSTAIMSAELLAAIAQVEGSGNPIARTYWRWSWTARPFEVFRPASSAVGMYQFTDSTFAEARHYCIRHHTVVEDGPWNDWQSCWFNRYYSRVIPAHAVELASAYLDRQVSRLLERHGVVSATLVQKQDLAALIHLCGAGAGNEYVQRGFRLHEGQRCGDQHARVYIARVSAMKAVFAHFIRQGLRPATAASAPGRAPPNSIS